MHCKCKSMHHPVLQVMQKRRLRPLSALRSVPAGACCFPARLPRQLRLPGCNPRLGPGLQQVLRPALGPLRVRQQRLLRAQRMGNCQVPPRPRQCRRTRR